MFEIQVGDKVICRSNEPERFDVGVVVRFDRIHSNEFPIVLINGKEYMVMGLVVKHTDELEKFMESLDWWEQWNVLCILKHKGRSYHIYIQDDAVNKEIKSGRTASGR